MLEKYDMVLVVPPWSLINTPNLGAHIIQAALKIKGINVFVLYTDQLLAKKLGLENYRKISEEYVNQYELIQERLFAKAAYPTEFSFLGKRVNREGVMYDTPRDSFELSVDWDYLYSIENIINRWLDEISNFLAKSHPKVIGFTLSHQQNNASIALINLVKKFNSDKVIVVGGSNCDGEMAKGILTLSPNIDYVFSGRCELLFAELFNDIIEKKVTNQILYSLRNIVQRNFFRIDYSDFFNQCKDNGFGDLNYCINIESSIGCWWSVKQQCNFCGVNGSFSGKYISRTLKEVCSEIISLKKTYNISNFRMVDTLMPPVIVRELLPKLIKERLSMFYELRANITFEELEVLKAAGVKNVQIGIESLNDESLKLINKGTTLIDNINSLRFCYILGISLGWNLLYDIPNETEQMWVETKKILPLIVHLIPPQYFRPIEIARFSPYFNKPDKYGIRDVMYFDVYNDIYPNSANISFLAWLFTGEYISSTKNNYGIISEVRESVRNWILSWSDPARRAHLTIVSIKHQLALVDTRGIEGCKRIQSITQKQASVALLGDRSIYFKQFKNWGIKNKIFLDVESRFLPLATSPLSYYKYILDKYV